MWFFQATSAHTVPPPQYFMPVPVRPMPMHMTATPVTRGGNILLSRFLGTKERKISRKEQIMTVPSILPYASSASVPSAFMALMPFSNTGRKVNEVPITESTPVPST
jgi:hypothetical protein